MKINLKNSVGVNKQVKLGFSWTMLFFGILKKKEKEIQKNIILQIQYQQ